MESIRVLNPIAAEPSESQALSPRVNDINGKTVGIRIQWSRFDVFANRLEEILRQKFNVAGVVKLHRQGPQGHTPDENKLWEEFKAKSDIAILGLAA